MCEKEKTLLSVYERVKQESLLAGNLPIPAKENALNAVAAEAVRRWLGDLPPGDEGLAEAYDRRYRTVEPLTWHWATLAHEWTETTEKQRRATSAGVAAVLAAHRARLFAEIGPDALAKAIRKAVVGPLFGDDGWNETLPSERESWCKAAVFLSEYFDAAGWLPPDEAEEMKANAKHELKQAVERMKARDRQHEITYRLLSNERDAAKQRLAEANAAKPESCPTLLATCHGGVPIPVAYIVTDQSCETVPWVMVNGVRYVRENAKTVAATRKDRV